MKKQFLQIDKVRANASVKDVFSSLALHLGFGFDSRTQVRYARRNARASGHPPYFFTLTTYQDT